VAGHPRVFAIADEDLERENDEKTSAVHFLRFELDPGMIASLRAGAALAAGIDHEHYRHAVHEVPASTRLALTADFR
jgi:precorrin-3B methylase